MYCLQSQTKRTESYCSIFIFLTNIFTIISTRITELFSFKISNKCVIHTRTNSILEWNFTKIHVVPTADFL